jgi:hypothetical protein
MDFKNGVRDQFRGMFDGMKERTRRDQAAVDAEEQADDAFRERSRAEAELAWKRLQHIMRGGQPSRDPNWNPDAPGMMPSAPPRKGAVEGMLDMVVPSAHAAGELDQSRPIPGPWQVVDSQTGRVIGTYKVRGMARAKQDKLDNEYGAYRYRVVPVR